MEYNEDDPSIKPQLLTTITIYNYDYLDVNDDEEELGDAFIDKNDASYNPRGYSHKFQQSQHAFERYPKRQRLKNQVYKFEFAPRNLRLFSYEDGDRDENTAFEWSEHEKFVLLEETSKIDRNEAQCRQMMDVLKMKYKKEKARESGTVGGFTIACGVDSGEYIFMDTSVFLDRSNMNDEMRDSPCESEEEGEEEEEGGSGGNEGVKGLRVLAESVQKFGEIYGKIESSKREEDGEEDEYNFDDEDDEQEDDYDDSGGNVCK
ncbi:unnamed protein product [Dovyalis caffra]|uniref:Uncharacterized protein n=1 Tax=Dovyalis caffra TaxID=77055 RepID=A0AAV1RIU9_9ROSI|nr:unnamed protein product [Dovyalis caffra]